MQNSLVNFTVPFPSIDYSNILFRLLYKFSKSKRESIHIKFDNSKKLIILWHLPFRIPILMLLLDTFSSFGSLLSKSFKYKYFTWQLRALFAFFKVNFSQKHPNTTLQFKTNIFLFFYFSHGCYKETEMWTKG